MVTISYCVSVADEAEELNRLLEQLSTYIEEEDELLILVDQGKVTGEVGQVINKWKGIIPSTKVIPSELNNDFATFKNNFLQHATKQHIWQLDCDEIVCEELLTDIKFIIQENPDVELYWLPRENYVEGIQERPDLISQWRWKVDEKGRINWKDPQARIFVNNGKICWERPVHEQIIGHKTFVFLPDNYFLIHKKTLERQIFQNSFYHNIIK